MSLKYLAKRVGSALLTLIAVTLVIFLVLRMMPGDILETKARDEAAQMGITYEEAYSRVATRYNYNPNEPILQQLVRYVGGLLRGDLGTSMTNPKLTVVSILVTALPWTLFVVSISLILSFIIGLQLGAVMAIRKKGIINTIITFYVTVVSTIPNYIVAILLSIVLVYQLGLFPQAGVYSIDVTPGFNLPFLLSALHHAILPIATYVLTSTGGWILNMKGSSIHTLGSDFVFAARARGLPDSIIMRKYMKKNAMIPLVTTLAMSFGGMMGGAPLVEGQFKYLGMGTYLATAQGERDYILYQGLLLCVSVSVIIANLIADLLYSKLDPRIRLE
ncbi:MAG TPA: ABC transporter permease [Firmicutes bacterium]|nr:ABC transporter permease [Bacillota bacterium]